MEFLNVKVCDTVEYPFKNPLPVHIYSKGNISSERVGVINLKVRDNLLMGDLEIDNNRISGDCTFLLFTIGGEIKTVLICPNIIPSLPISVN